MTCVTSRGTLLMQTEALRLFLKETFFLTSFIRGASWHEGDNLQHPADSCDL